MSAINSRSRNPMILLVSMLLRSSHASTAGSTGVLPFLMLYFGPRTAVAGLLVRLGRFV